MLLQSKNSWTKLHQSRAFFNLPPPAPQTPSSVRCFTWASDHKRLLYASTRFHDVMSTEFAKQRRRRSCLALYSVVSDGSRSVFSYPAGFWQPLLWHDWIVLGQRASEGGREGVFAKWRTVGPVHERACPPGMFPLERKEKVVVLPKTVLLD